MKARPRSVEREVARALSRFFIQNGLSAVERIPVLGRTGPDITIGELGLVIDVKSRLEVPKSCFAARDAVMAYAGELVGLRLADIRLLTEEARVVQVPFHSVLVQRWYAHMDDWTQQFHPGGISALVLHRPKMPIGDALLILSRENRRRLIQWKTTR